MSAINAGESTARRAANQCSGHVSVAGALAGVVAGVVAGELGRGYQEGTERVLWTGL